MASGGNVDGFGKGGLPYRFAVDQHLGTRGADRNLNATELGSCCCEPFLGLTSFSA